MCVRLELASWEAGRALGCGAMYRSRTAPIILLKSLKIIGNGINGECRQRTKRTFSVFTGGKSMMQLRWSVTSTSENDWDTAGCH